jgi:hypothetical protein
MEPQEILDRTREAIRNHAGGNPDKWFYANRFVFARLQLDERGTKTKIKKELLEANKPCNYCNNLFENRIGIHLHRVNGKHGYSRDNCVLMHSECHTKFHLENPRSELSDRLSEQEQPENAVPILEKYSKRYDEWSFTYWWDISPGFLDKIDKYEAVEFVKKDSGERCYVPTAALKGYLTEQRKTTRGNGNWGIKVLKDKDSELAFEPAGQSDKWLFLPVIWLNETQED